MNRMNPNKSIVETPGNSISLSRKYGSSGFLVGGHKRVADHDARACRSERAHSFIAERFSERPGAVKAARGAAKRSLDGEDCAGTIPQEGMARWEVRLSPIASTHYKPGIPRFLEQIWPSAQQGRGVALFEWVGECYLNFGEIKWGPARSRPVPSSMAACLLGRAQQRNRAKWRLRFHLFRVKGLIASSGRCPIGSRSNYKAAVATQMPCNCRLGTVRNNSPYTVLVPRMKWLKPAQRASAPS